MGRVSGGGGMREGGRSGGHGLVNSLFERNPNILRPSNLVVKFLLSDNDI